MTNSNDLIGGTSPAHQRMVRMMDAGSRKDTPPLGNDSLHDGNEYRRLEQRALGGDSAARAKIIAGEVKPKGT